MWLKLSCHWPESTSSILTCEATAQIFKENVAALSDGLYGVDFIAMSGRKDNREYIVGIIAPSKSDPYSLQIVSIPWGRSQSNGH